ncbi:MAG: FGGY family carbohydrate kinase [Chloroflexi bacterium]|nr:FGGY family carbohydrate kinase [Chloroflexota bacterium]MCY4246440.1 FGGY family carbohydrate kinase [Chloroflexota bacterium]
MADHIVLGIDLGTQGLKVVAVRADDASIIGAAAASVPSLTPAPGWLEQQPEAWWRILCGLMRKLLREPGISPESVLGIGLSGHMHSVVPLRADGSLAHNCIVWADTRSQPQASSLAAKLQERLWNPAIAPYSLAKLLWLREHQPAVYDETAVALFPKDYLRWRMAGAIASDYSDASASLMWDFAARHWDEKLLADLNIRADLLPPVAASCAPCGALTPRAAAELGLLPGTIVAYGGGDAACAVVGAGIPDDATLLINAGTAVQVIQLIAKPTPFAAERAIRYLFELGVDARCFVIGALNSAGHSLDWWRRLLDPAQSHADLETLAAKAPGGADAPIFLPWLQGTGTPFLLDGPYGSFAQLSATADKPALTRAIYDGVAMGIRLCAEALVGEKALATKRLLFTGGLPKSPLMRQILADVFGREIRCRSFSDMSALGAAAHAAVAAGSAENAQSWLADFDYGEISQLASDTRAEPYRSAYDRYKLWAARITANADGQVSS